MTESQSRAITIRPVISYPREAEAGKTYLMSIDIQTELDGEDWPYKREDYALHCFLNTKPLFKHQPLGEPVIVLNRFGGTYGPATFLLTAASTPQEGTISISLVNEQGMPLRQVILPNITIRKQGAVSRKSAPQLIDKDIEVVREHARTTNLNRLLEIRKTAPKNGKSVRVAQFLRQAGEPAWGPLELGIELGGPGHSLPAVPAVAQGVAVFALHNGELCGITLADGRERWRTVLEPGRMPRYIVQDDERLLASAVDERAIGASESAHLIAIHPKSGEITSLWTADGYQLTPPALTQDFILLQSDSRTVFALHRADLSTAWRHRMEAWWPLPPYPAGDLVLLCDSRIASGESDLVALDLRKGHERWRVPLAGMLSQPPAALGELLVFVNGRKQLVGLDLRSAEIRWQRDFRKIYSAPIPGEERIYLVVRGSAGSGESGHYRVLAFDAEGKITLEIPLPPGARARLGTFYREMLYLGTDDGRILAYHTGDGMLRWAFDFHPGEPDSRDKIHTHLLIEDNLLVAGTYTGKIVTLHLETPAAARHTPQVYLEAGDFESAAAAFAWQGDLRRAAEIYAEQLHDYEKAIVLYDHLGLHHTAGELAEQLQQFERAAAFYQQAGDQRAQAAMLAKMGDLLGAAELYAQDEDWWQAAQLYEEAGEFHEAGKIYVRLGSLTDVIRIKVKKGLNWLTENDIEVLKEHADPREVGELALQAGKYAKAAKLFEQAGDESRQMDALLLVVHNSPNEVWAWEALSRLAPKLNRLPEAGEAALQSGELTRAAQFFRESGDLRRALEALQTLVAREPEDDTAWHQITKIARQLGDFVTEANAWVHFQNFEDAADAWYRAALQAERTMPEQREQIAALFEQARHFFEESGLDSEAQACRDKIIYYRDLPFVIVEGLIKKTFREMEFNSLALEIRNVGHGVAHEVRVQLSKTRFELDETSQQVLIRRLHPGRPKTATIFARPLQNQIGEKVPLVLEWAWKDRHGREYREKSLTYVTVKRQDASQTGGPQEIHYHGPVYQGEHTEVVDGDKLDVGAQKGDRVEIHRKKEFRLRPRKPKPTSPLPFVIVEGRIKKTFHEMEFNSLTLEIRNVGHGVAHDVHVQLSETRFELDETSQQVLIRRLHPDRPKTATIFARPLQNQIGEKVPLVLEWAWKDRHGREYREKSLTYVTVKRQDASQTWDSPQEIHYHGPVYQGEHTEVVDGDKLGGDLIQGDKLDAGAQKGDRVEIHRGGGVRPQKPKPTTPPSADEVLCPNCHLPIGPDDKFCDGCGAPLHR